MHSVHMENALNPVTVAPDLIAARSAALSAYNDAVNDDGVSASTWDAIARELAVVAAQLAGDRAEFVRARSVDAIGRGNYARQMVAAARRMAVQS
jgi:L-alanine-DL-glutamate epimerase-like enolase superfamily enzyme